MILSVSNKVNLVDQNYLLSKDVHLMFLGSWTYSEAEETWSSKEKEDTTSLWLVMMSHLVWRLISACFLGSIITVTPHQSEVVTDHEDVDTSPTFLDLSKNMSGKIVCAMLKIIPLQVMSAR